MKTVIINADDFGLSPGVNNGIIKAAREGMLTSTSVMVSASYVKQAIEMLNDSGVKLGLGLHIVLNGTIPTYSKSPLFTSDTGFLSLSEWDDSNEKEFVNEMKHEIKSQLDVFVQLTGKMPDHIDSHHNICFKHPLLKKITMEILAELKLPIRDPSKTDWLTIKEKEEINNPLLLELKEMGIEVARTLRDFRGDGANYSTLSSILMKIPDTGIYEIMCHVGYFDEILRENSSYDELREAELNVLLDPRIKRIMVEQNFKLVTYEEAYKAM